MLYYMADVNGRAYCVYAKSEREARARIARNAGVSMSSVSVKGVG